MAVGFFGFLPDNREARLDEITLLRLRKEGERSVYERLEGEAVVSRALLAPGVSVLVAPYPPFLLPLHGRLNCLYVRLPSPVVVPSGSRIRVEVTVPYDIAVIASSRGSHSLIDVMPPPGVVPKMAVYGSSMEGMLCRFWVSRPGGPGARSVVEIENPSETQAVVTKVVMPRKGFLTYYNPSTGDIVASTAVMAIRDDNTADVTLAQPKLGEGYTEVPTVERDKRLFEALGNLIPARIAMVWGI